MRSWVDGPSPPFNPTMLTGFPITGPLWKILLRISSETGIPTSLLFRLLWKDKGFREAYLRRKQEESAVEHVELRRVLAHLLNERISLIPCTKNSNFHRSVSFNQSLCRLRGLQHREMHPAKLHLVNRLLLLLTLTFYISRVPWHLESDPFAGLEQGLHLLQVLQVFIGKKWKLLLFPFDFWYFLRFSHINLISPPAVVLFSASFRRHRGSRRSLARLGQRLQGTIAKRRSWKVKVNTIWEVFFFHYNSARQLASQDYQIHFAGKQCFFACHQNSCWSFQEVVHCQRTLETRMISVWRAWRKQCSNCWSSFNVTLSYFLTCTTKFGEAKLSFGLSFIATVLVQMV